jgi:hypothetical protein
VSKINGVKKDEEGEQRVFGQKHIGAPNICFMLPQLLDNLYVTLLAGLDKSRLGNGTLGRRGCVRNCGSTAERGCHVKRQKTEDWHDLTSH